ncbi:hybrid signal transduction histidine kinase L-like [Ochlerotatus camptorhynchus]|uniref:hybrid signal transduction histidine kinase L-like n=1 Tax=Ochlerotatus camptorhynchus TaxID=644619 RepID=UPI0031D18DF0
MKAFVAVLALVAAVAGDVSIQQPNSHLQPPVEHHTSNNFNAPWVKENAWRPAADPNQPIHVPQQSSYYTEVQHGNNNQAYQQEQQQYQPHQQIDVAQQTSYATVQHGTNSQNCQQDQQQYQPDQQIDVAQQSSYYAPEQHGSNNQGYQQQHHHHQEQHQQQGHYQNHNAPSSVAVQVTHPDWATSFSNVNRYNTYWPAAPVAPVMIAPVPFMPAANVFTAPAPFSKPTQAPVAVYNNNVAKWNPWNNNQHSHRHHHQPSHDIAKVPHSVAKYVAITPGSIHIAPLPGHTVSHKFVNPGGSW